mmetsp:Transcript_7504/g.25818  ORF Transcript_7504/g.25818 Transcript_7504/m.25818 type:complete len:257 (-) Transcript_7504:4040-4810(-)
MEACHRRGLARRGAPVRVAACASCRHRGHHLRPGESGAGGPRVPGAQGARIPVHVRRDPPAAHAARVRQALPCASKGEAAARGERVPGLGAHGGALPGGARPRRGILCGGFRLGSRRVALRFRPSLPPHRRCRLCRQIRPPVEPRVPQRPQGHRAAVRNPGLRRAPWAPVRIAGAVRRPWILRSGNLWTRVAKAPWDLLRLCCGLFHGNQGIPVRRDRPGLPDRNPCGLPRVPRVLGQGKVKNAGDVVEHVPWGLL